MNLEDQDEAYESKRRLMIVSLKIMELHRLLCSLVVTKFNPQTGCCSPCTVGEPKSI